MTTNGWIDRPLKRLKRFPRSSGINLVPIEHALKGDRFLRPIGQALKKEYGKRLTPAEYWRKSMTKYGMDSTSLGLSTILIRVNKRLKEQIRGHLQ
jgi:hypothetical protein